MKRNIYGLFILAAFTAGIFAFLLLEKRKGFSYRPFCAGSLLGEKSFLIEKSGNLEASGKYGFLIQRNGNFYFENGKKVKFWGTNLCFSACFPEKKLAEEIAKRIAYFGFNAVRLHHLDYYSQPEGIFKSKSNTMELSEEQLDKLDYLIYQLKKNGIYIDLNLLVSRHFKKADGVIDAEKLRIAGKPVCIFDKKLISLQKDYAQKLLLHENPYTGLKYRDDPSIAFIEIINEMSLRYEWEKGRLAKIPDHYKKELKEIFNKWFKEKYKKDPPEFPFKKEKQMKKELEETIIRFFSYIELSYYMEMKNFLKEELKVKALIGCGGHFAYPERELQEKAFDFSNFHIYLSHPTFPTGKWDKRIFNIKNAQVKNNKKLLEKIKELSGRKAVIISEWNLCYPGKYAYQMPLYIAEKAREKGVDAVFQFAFAQKEKAFREKCKILNFFDITSNPQQLILCSYAGKLFLYGKKDFSYKITEKYTLIKKNDRKIYIGRIKNTDSRFKYGDHYPWGKAPTLLEIKY